MINNTLDRKKRDALVLSNARGMIQAHKSTSNGRLYRDLFGTGFGTARASCVDLGIDPDGNETSYNKMIAHLESA